MATHFEREHENETNSSMLEEPKIEKVNNNNNNRSLLVGTSFSGKTYLMFKILSRLPDPDLYKISKSSPEQYSIYKIEIKQKSDQIKLLNECQKSVIVFDDILGSSNSRDIDQSFIRSRHIDLVIYHL